MYLNKEKQYFFVSCMKKLIIGAMMLFSMFFILFGCTKTEETSLVEISNRTIESNTLSMEDLITVSNDENLATIYIKASKIANQWQFPLKKYEKNFARVGLHSETFIKLDKTQISFLDDNEAIWLTPLIRNNSSVLFNAVYSNEFSECNVQKLKILGKDYDLNNLKNGSGFRNDDKWKILLDYENNCLRSLIIYLDGYFYNMKNDEQINLFRNDNTIILSFEELENEPKIKIVTNKPLHEIKNKEPAPNKDFVKEYLVESRRYENRNLSIEAQIVNWSGLFVQFKPSISMCIYENCSEDGYLTERQVLILKLFDKELLLIKLRKNKNSEELILAKEIDNKILNRYSCAVENDNRIKIVDKELAVEEFWHRHEPNAMATFYNLNDSEEKMNISSGQSVKVDNIFLHVWYFGFDYTYCADWVFVSTLSDIINLTDPTNNITLTWENENSSNPTLKSIFIPRSSPIFEKLMNVS